MHCVGGQALVYALFCGSPNFPVFVKNFSLLVLTNTVTIHHRLNKMHIQTTTKRTVCVSGCGYKQEHECENQKNREQKCLLKASRYLYKKYTVPLKNFPLCSTCAYLYVYRNSHFFAVKNLA